MRCFGGVYSGEYDVVLAKMCKVKCLCNPSTVRKRPILAAGWVVVVVTSALLQLCTTLQALGAQLVNSVVDCAV